MSMSPSAFRALLGLVAANVAITGFTIYQGTEAKRLLEYNYEEAEARFDEMEGTLRGHIGLIEESLERIEGHIAKAAGKDNGWGKGMGSKAEAMYLQRGRDSKA